MEFCDTVYSRTQARASVAAGSAFIHTDCRQCATKPHFHFEV
jgi:hypothetical protein